jgi:hypothetical protein
MTKQRKLAQNLVTEGTLIFFLIIFYHHFLLIISKMKTCNFKHEAEFYLTIFKKD